MKKKKQLLLCRAMVFVLLVYIRHYHLQNAMGHSMKYTVSPKFISGHLIQIPLMLFRVSCVHITRVGQLQLIPQEGQMDYLAPPHTNWSAVFKPIEEFHLVVLWFHIHGLRSATSFLNIIQRLLHRRYRCQCFYKSIYKSDGGRPCKNRNRKQKDLSICSRLVS